MTHLVIGAGPAGLAAIDTIREFGDQTPITLVSNEPAYSRMVLPYWMDGTIPEANLFTADADYLDKLSVTTHFEKAVTRLDPAGTATLDDGTSVAFTDALIATGSTATRPPLPGFDSPGVYNLWNLEDAREVIAKAGGEVVVIGAGFIAFTCLDALVHLGAKVTVLELEDRILPRMIDDLGAKLVQRHLESRGVSFITSARVTAIEDEGGRKVLVLDGHQAVQADVVVVATGIRPNLELIEESGIETDFGIVVDEQLRSSAPNVFAAGDIAQGPIIGDSTKQVHAIQPTALEHGRVAGANMAGHAIDYWGSLLMNIVDVQKLQIASFGDWLGEGRDASTISNDARPMYRKLVFDEDVLTGAIFLGRPDDVALLNDMGMAKGLIQTQTPLKQWRQYLDENPLDLRRPYVASGAAQKLLQMRVVAKPSSNYGFRQPDPAPKYWEHHEIFVSSIREINES